MSIYISSFDRLKLLMTSQICTIELSVFGDEDQTIKPN